MDTVDVFVSVNGWRWRKQTESILTHIRGPDIIVQRSGSVLSTLAQEIVRLKAIVFQKRFNFHELTCNLEPPTACCEPRKRLLAVEWEEYRLQQLDIATKEH